MLYSQKGFSLIELMTVVGIIGVLSAVALPQYAKYQAKTKMTAALAEISALKSGYESVVNNGDTPTLSNIGVGGLATADDTGKTTSHCKIQLISSGGGIKCTLQSAPAAISTAIISLTRDATTGVWTCGINSSNASKKIDTSYNPKGCVLDPN